MQFTHFVIHFILLRGSCDKDVARALLALRCELRAVLRNACYAVSLCVVVLLRACVACLRDYVRDCSMT
jgi:hypothetical protein